MDEGRKRTMLIAAAILVARHMKTADDLFASPSPRTEALIAAAVQWSERILHKIDTKYPTERFPS